MAPICSGVPSARSPQALCEQVPPINKAHVARLGARPIGSAAAAVSEPQAPSPKQRTCAQQRQ